VYPPFHDPVWDLKLPKYGTEVRKIFYQEDIERAAKQREENAAGHDRPPMKKGRQIEKSSEAYRKAPLAFSLSAERLNLQEEMKEEN
jgi:hypothetical protein